MNMNSNGMDWTRNTNTNASSRYPFLQDEYDDDDRDQDEQEDEPWTVPDRAAMQKRWAFRESILRDTVDHRRIHAHGGNGDTGRNILYILRDRERHGPDGLTLRHARQVKRYEQKGDRSPSTVFESPISTTQTLETTNHNPPVGLRLPKSQSRDHDHDDSKERLPRRVSYPLKIVHEIRTFGEYFSATKYHSSFLHHLGGDDELDENGNRPASSNAVSTISVAFSPDAQTMASTHGDHSVKITSCTTGRLLQALEGHPRTPWTVKYHPKDPRIVASGCLGHQVRIWNWEEKTCLQMVRLEFAIISLSFHPTGKLLAVANGTRLHFWGIDDPDEAPARSNNRASLLTEMDQRHMLRCVHFPPDGKSIIIGGVNPTTEDPRRRTRGGIGGGGGMSFYLRMWDFDPETALQPYSDSVTVGSFMTRRAISNPRTFVPRALLYNDGGFDVSPDGKTLCACAEYWLPDGVDNAMELLHLEEQAHNAEMEKAEEAARERESRRELSSADAHAAVSAALTSALKGAAPENGDSRLASASARQAIARNLPQMPLPRTPTDQSSLDAPPLMDYVPSTPPNPRPRSLRLSPPSPPGRRFPGGLRQGRETVSTSGGQPVPESGGDGRGTGTLTPPPPPPPPPPAAPGGIGSRPPHPLSMISSTADSMSQKGRYVPHVVTVSLETSPLPEGLESASKRGKLPGAVAKGHQPRLGQLLEACPLDGTKASAVTCVKFSGSAEFCLIGYGVREPVVEGGSQFHPVTAIYRVRGGMTHVSTMLSGDDDVNIARFHPESGHGFVYGTKQGRVRVLAPQPWNYYNC